MTIVEIIKKIEQSNNEPSIMVDTKGNIRTIVIKKIDETKEKIEFYEFNRLTIDYQEWIEEQRDEAALENIHVNDILSFYSSIELIELIKDFAVYQKKNIEEDEAIAKEAKINCVEMSIFVPKDKTF